MESETGAKEELRLVLVGLQSVGKSAAGNTILGSKIFESDISSSALTRQTRCHENQVCERSVILVDTPGLFNNTLSETETKQQMEKALTYCQPGPHAFLIVIQLGRFTEQEKGVMDKLVEMLGSNINLYSILLFTYGDKLKNKTIDNFVKEDKNLMELIGKCEGRYHLFNNVDTKNKDQVTDLWKKIHAMIRKRGKKPFYVQGAKHVQSSWSKFLYFILPVVVILAVNKMLTKKPAPEIDYQSNKTIKEVISYEVTKRATELVPVQPGDVLWRSGQLWRMLHQVDLKWKELIPVVLALGLGWWILKKLRK